MAITLFVNDFEGTAQAALGTAHEEQRTDGVDGCALTPDDFTHVSRVNAQFVNGGAVALGWGNRHRVRAVYQPFNYVIQKGFHK
jgi:hypothetical protein